MVSGETRGERQVVAMGRHLKPMNPEQMIRISASILAADFSNLGGAVRDAESAGVDSIHVDFMDGHYVHNFSFGIELLAALRPHTSLPTLPGPVPI